MENFNFGKTASKNANAREIHSKNIHSKNIHSMKKETVTDKKEEVKLTHSGFLSVNGRRAVSVRFERGEDVAEGMLPPGKLTKNQGFTEEEIAILSFLNMFKNKVTFLLFTRVSKMQTLIFVMEFSQRVPILPVGLT